MTIPGVTPFSGQLPAEGEPASFPARAEALFDWLVGNAAPEIGAVAEGINDALNDNGTVLDATALAVQLTTNANTLVTTGGTGNAYTITPAATVPAYAAGQTFMLRPNRANTGAVTLNVGGLGAVPVRKPGTSGGGFVELAADDWQDGDVHIVAYQGSQFELLTVPLQSFVRNDAEQEISGEWTFSATATFDDIMAAVMTAQDVVLAKNSPAIAWSDTTGTANTHRIVDARYNDSVWSLDVRSSTGIFVQRALQITMNAAGALTWGFNVGATQRLGIAGTTVSVTGGLSVSGAVTAGAGLTINGVTLPQAGSPDIGSSSLGRFGTIFLVNNPNVSSDARLKNHIADLTDAERRAAARMRTRTFTMNGQRKVGYVAQEIIAAMEAEGLDAIAYGLVTDGEFFGVDMDAINAFRLG